jgi:hypothetical protein
MKKNTIKNNLLCIICGNPPTKDNNFPVRTDRNNGKFHHKCHIKNCSILYHHHISLKDYNKIANFQKKACFGCCKKFSSISICIDHDHKCCKISKSCGKCIRAILCKHCNGKVLSEIEKFNVEKLETDCVIRQRLIIVAKSKNWMEVMKASKIYKNTGKY